MATASFKDNRTQKVIAYTIIPFSLNIITLTQIVFEIVTTLFKIRSLLLVLI